MKVSEARKIVSEMISWEMFHMGLLQEKPQQINYSLEEMIKANRIVKNRNKRDTSKMVMGKTYRRKIQTTCADRLIAAIYVAMNYEVSPESITCCNGKYVGVFS